MRILRMLTFVLGAGMFLLFTQSCKEDKLGDPIIVSNIKKEFYLDLSETLSPTQRFTHLYVQTIEDGACLNGTIDFDFNHTGNRITLSVNGVVEPDDCIPGVAPFQSDVAAGVLQNGFYVFNFNLRSTIKNQGNLIVEGDRYLLNLASEDGVILLHREIFRVPENTLWGYLAYDEPAEEGNAQEILDEFQFIGISPNLGKGYYGYFTINTTVEGVEITGAPETNFLKSFVYNYDGDWDYVKDLAEGLSEDYPNISLKLFDDKGRVY